MQSMCLQAQDFYNQFGTHHTAEALRREILHLLHLHQYPSYYPGMAMGIIAACVPCTTYEIVPGVVSCATSWLGFGLPFPS